MKHRKSLVAIAGLAVLGVTLWLLLREEPKAKPVEQTTRAEPTATASPTYLTTTAPRQEPGGPYAPADPRWPERTRKLKTDPQYEWKTPIEFYGKVVDQDGKPVAGAIADVIWTDMSAEGSSTMEVVSDSSGLFSITGIRGKHMTVQVNKEGYYRQLAGTQSAFEYAGFWEPTYHVPDKKNPVIFRLRKKGEPAPLVTSDGKFVLTFGTPVSIPMRKASETASPIKVTVFENDPNTRQWRAQVYVEGGGIIPALDEFPFEAPKEGYQSSIDLNQESPHPPGWQDIDEGGWFYIKTDQGYGLLKLRQIRGKKTLRYEVMINTEGGTNLEPSRL